MNFDEKILLCLRPVKEASSDLRYSEEMDMLREIRREDDQNVSYGIWEFPLKNSDWGLLEEKAIAFLSSKSKDIEVLGWVIESWMALYAFEGLIKGLELFLAFTHKFWDSFIPKDQDTRASYIEVFDRHISDHLIRFPIFQNGDKKLTLIDWRNCMHMKKLVGQDPEILGTLYNQYKMDINRFHMLFNSHTQGDVEKLSNCVAEIEALLQSIISVWTDFYVPHVRQAIAEIKDIIDGYKPYEAEAIEEIKPQTIQQITTQEDAYKALLELCDYLQEFNPNSMKPKLIRYILQYNE